MRGARIAFTLFVCGCGARTGLDVRGGGGGGDASGGTLGDAVGSDAPEDVSVDDATGDALGDAATSDDGGATYDAGPPLRRLALIGNDSLPKALTLRWADELTGTLTTIGPLPPLHESDTANWVSPDGRHALLIESPLLTHDTPGTAAVIGIDGMVSKPVAPLVRTTSFDASWGARSNTVCWYTDTETFVWDVARGTNRYAATGGCKVSYDGRAVAMLGGASGVSTLFVERDEGSAIIVGQAPAGGLVGDGFEWSPTEARLLFDVGDTVGNHTYYTDAPGETPIRRFGPGDGDVGPILPDGSAFLATDASGALIAIPMRGPDSTKTVLAPSDSWDGVLERELSADRTYASYLPRSGSPPKMGIVPVSHWAKPALTTGSSGVWAPSGHRRSVTADDGSITVLDDEHGPPHWIVRPGEVAAALAWSHDGNSMFVAYGGGAPDSGLPCIVDIATSGRTCLPAPMKDFGPVRWSMDDQAVAFRSAGDIYIIRVDLRGGARKVATTTFSTVAFWWY